ncbi:MAG TPA: hypothetical protein VK749_20780 [Xanthobacteraceae bacterium]|nr:hypothetical protein [Xanthobacteraceae bacterium]
MANNPVTRRTALGAAAFEATQAMAQAEARKTFVLVHGAWHGGWCWRRAADSLEQRGHKVYAQSLTGKRETIAKKAYIRAPKYPQAAFDKALAECKADPTWQTFVNDDTGHDVMIDQPQWLADVLLKVS